MSLANEVWSEPVRGPLLFFSSNLTLASVARPTTPWSLTVAFSSRAFFEFHFSSSARPMGLQPSLALSDAETLPSSACSPSAVKETSFETLLTRLRRRMLNL
eukprot:Amastigsp_a508710_2005.p3 type:complete len:102 gc:universal Amastigsp_a508710_2005:498-803(+)